jgi:hypothetical protein
MAAAAAEDDDGEDDHRDGEGSDHRHPGWGGPPGRCRFFLLA